MDTVTHAALGGVIGQAGFHRRLGARAAAWGALAGLLPDLDVLAIPALGPLAEFQFHRGATHTLWFGPLVGPLLGYAVWRSSRAHGAQAGHGAQPAQGAQAGRPPDGASPLGAWVALFVLALATHPLLDLFTIYGTVLLFPFSDRRFALPAVPIIDPLYTAPLFAALAIGVAARRQPRVATVAAAAALAFTTGYLFHGLRQNALADAQARRQLAAEGIAHERVRTYTTIFQVYLRRVVVHTRDEVLVGFVSTWEPGPIRWRRFPIESGPLVDRVRATEAGRVFEWFAMGETLARVAREGEVTTVEVTDLRYGFPGTNERGFWGLRARVDGEGRLVGAPERFDIPRQVDRASLGALFRAAFGLPNDLL